MISRKKIIEVFSSNAIRVVYGMVLMVFITNHYSMEATGGYFLVLAIMTLLNDLKEGFFLSGFIKYMVEDEANSMKVASTGLITSLVWDILNILIFFLLIIWFPSLEVFTIAYVINLVLSSFSKWIAYIHRGKMETNLQLKSNIVALVTVALGIFGVHLYNFSIENCLIILGLSNFIPSIIIKKNLQLISEAFRNFHFDAGIFKKLSYFGKFGVLLAIAGGLSHQSGIFLSAEFLDLGATALLGLGSRYAILLVLPGNSLSSLIYPQILKCRNDREKIRSTAIFGIAKMYSILIPIGILIMLGSPLGILILHGEEYLFVSIILAFKTIVLLINLPLSSAYTSTMNTLDKPYMVTMLVVVNSVVNLILIAPMMYLWGIWGALIAPFSIEILGFIIMRNKLYKEINLQLKDIPHQVWMFWKYWMTIYNPKRLVARFKTQFG